MTVHTHRDSLMEKHHAIEAALAEEQHRPIPDTLRMTELKRRKLKIKEEISKISGNPH